MIKKLIDKYGFKFRSLPNFSTFRKYFDAYMYVLFFYLVYNFINICLFSGGFSLEFPMIFYFLVPIVFISVYSKIENSFKTVNDDDFKKVIAFIRIKHNQSLYNELKLKPEILKGKYKNKSLLNWARHYKNPKANTIITKIFLEQ